MNEISNETCLERGGHCYNQYGANDVVDDFGISKGVRTLLYYPDGEPQYRICRHCKKQQILKNEWQNT